MSYVKASQSGEPRGSRAPHLAERGRLRAAHRSGGGNPFSALSSFASQEFSLHGRSSLGTKTEPFFHETTHCILSLYLSLS